jgi:hypothetical protein
MQEHVARTLCHVSATERGSGCSTCEGGQCTLWPTFMNEADAAIQAVRAFALLTPRKKPNIRS